MGVVSFCCCKVFFRRKARSKENARRIMRKFRVRYLFGAISVCCIKYRYKAGALKKGCRRFSPHELRRNRPDYSEMPGPPDMAVRKTERPFARQAEDEVIAVKLVIICFYLFFLSFSGVNLYLFFVFAKFIAENFLFVAIF